jgi:hypothetical protein
MICSLNFGVKVRCHIGLWKTADESRESHPLGVVVQMVWFTRTAAPPLDLPLLSDMQELQWLQC